MKESEKSKKKRTFIDAVIIAAIAAIVALVVFLVTYKKETWITEEYDYGDTLALACTSHENDPEVAFFSSETATSVEHIVKMVYNNDKVQKISYEYEGKYDSDDEAKEDSGAMHTKYNIYLGDHGIDHAILTPVFQYTGKKALIRLYLDDYNKMNSTLGKIFYIGNGMKDTVGKNSAKETKKLYENKGFSCIIND